jgi:hypothetical protein
MTDKMDIKCMCDPVQIILLASDVIGGLYKTLYLRPPTKKEKAINTEIYLNFE